MAVDVTRCAWLLLTAVVVLSSTSCSPRDPRFEKRAVGPVSVLREDEYRYGGASFYADAGRLMIIKAILHPPKGGKDVATYVHVPGYEPISLADVSLESLRETFDNGSERQFAGSNIFKVGSAKCSFSFGDSLEHVSVDEGPGIQVSLGEESAKVTIPCTVNELRQAFGEPDEIKLAK